MDEELRKELAAAVEARDKRMGDTNARIEELQRQLAEMNVGVAVWCSVKLPGLPWRVGYAKRKTGWALVARHEGIVNPPYSIALLDAPAAVRVAALPFLDDVVHLIVARLQEIAR